MILLTNDDGYFADGIQSVYRELKQYYKVKVIAPYTEQSECGHRVTTKHTLEVVEIKEDILAVKGTPADCVRIAKHLYGSSIDFCISGVNNGGNLGADIFISGTVAAAREACYHDIPSIAFSQYRKPSVQPNWDVNAIKVRMLYEQLKNRCEKSVFLNINFPCVDDVLQAEIVECEVDRAPLPLNYDLIESAYRYSGRYAERIKTPGFDVYECFNGKISCSKLSL